MKLEKTDSLCLFVSPTPSPVKAGGMLSIVFDGDGHLLLNGKHTFTPKDGAFLIPHRLLSEGENTLSLSSGSGSTPCEGLSVRDGLITPSGIGERDAVRLLFSEVLRLRTALQRQAKEICILQEKTKERTLFS